MTNSSYISQLISEHDERPEAVAAALRTLNFDTVAIQDFSRLTWLINHVVGEKLANWKEAAALCERVSPANNNLSVLINKAVACAWAGDPIKAYAYCSRLKLAAEATYSQADIAVRLGILQYAGPTASGMENATVLFGCFKELETWSSYGPMATIYAGSLNNIVSNLLDSEVADSTGPLVHAAIKKGSILCRQLWQEAGNWLNHERAEYLIALAHNKASDWSRAAEAARAGLETIELNGSEEVDKAFLLLELARALTGLGDVKGRQRAYREAMAIAEVFEEPELKPWFDSKASIVAAMAP